MSKRLFISIILVISIIALIIIAGVSWINFSHNTSISSPASSTPTTASNSATLTSTPKPSTTSKNSATPQPSVTILETPNPSIITSPTLPSQPTTIITTSPTPNPTPSPTQSQPKIVIFNFDNATPTLPVRQPTPFDHTYNGITANFSSPTDTPLRPAFSLQNTNSLAAISTVINSAKFSGLFLWPNSINRDRLDINFSQNINSISFFFKTAELHDPGPGGTGSPIRLTAHMNSTSTIVGSPITVNGVETPFDNYPEGTLTFTAGGQPFNFVEIDLPSTGASGFIIDNIIIEAI